VNINRFYHILIFFLFFSKGLIAQELLQKRISIDFREKNIEFVIDEITRLSKVHFSYNPELFLEDQRFTISKENATIAEILDLLLLGTEIAYDEFKRQIIFYKRKVDPGVLRKTSGVLIDSLSNERIHQAHVYLNNTDIGTYSDIDGAFTLENISEGRYELIISHVSYGIRNYFLDVASDIENYEFFISPRTNILEEIEIISDNDPLYRNYYIKFMQELLGKTSNSQYCVINNPEDILIDNRSNDIIGEFEVYTKKPISITNYALGYHVLYDLIFFESRDNKILYIGKTNFTKLEAKSKQQERQWKKNRLKVYQGSLRAFAGFQTKSRKGNFKKEKVKTIPDSLKYKYLSGNLQSMEIIDLIKTKNELGENEYFKIRHKKSKQISYLGQVKLGLEDEYKNKLIKDFFNPKNGIAVYGKWAENRIADILPLNFLNSKKKSLKWLRGKRK